MAIAGPSPLPAEGGDRHRALALVLVMAFAALCAGLGLIHASHSFSLDETFTVRLTRGPWLPLLAGRAEPGAILYNAVLKAWSAFSGTDEAAARTLSVLAATAAVPALYVAGKPLVGRAASLVACGLLAVSPLVMVEAHNARAYALLLLLTTISMALFVRAAEEKSWTLGLLHGLVTVLAVYTHFFAGLVLAAQWAALLMSRHRVPRGLIAGTAGALVLCTPLVLLVHGGNLATVSWIPHTTVRSLVGVFAAISGGLAVLPLFATLAAVATLKWWRDWRVFGVDESWAGLFIVTSVLLPVVLAVIVSLWQPIVVARYFVILLAPLMLAAGTGLVELWRWRRSMGALGLLGLVAAAPLALARAYGRPPEDWRGAVEYVVARAGPADRLAAIERYHLSPIDYYLQQRLPVVGPPLLDLRADPPRCILLVYWAADLQSREHFSGDDGHFLADHYRSVNVVSRGGVAVDALQRKDQSEDCPSG